MDHVPFHHIAAGHPAVFVYGFVSVDSDEIFSCGCEFAVGVSGCDFQSLVGCQTAGRLLDNSENLGEGCVKLTRIHLEAFVALLVYFLPERFALVIVQSFDLGADLLYLVLIL